MNIDEEIEKLKNYSEILKFELVDFTIKSRNKLANSIEIAVKHIEQLKADKNKLINYIAIRENKTYEEVCKEFEV